MSVQKIDTKSLDAIRELPITGQQPRDEQEEKFLREVCDFEFINLEEPGVMHKFPYGSTRKSHTFNLMHGGTYKLPRFIARHIESCSTPIWEWRPNGLGGLEKKFLGTKPRFQMRQVYGSR